MKPYIRLSLSSCFRVIDVDGSLIDEERDLSQLTQRYANSVQQSVHADNASEKTKLEKHGIKEWDFGEIKTTIEYQHQGMTVTAFPCLYHEKDDSLSLLITDREAFARYQTHNGVLHLAYQTLANGGQRQAAKILNKDLFATKSGKQQSNNSVGNLSNLAAQLKRVSTKPANRSQWVKQTLLAGIKYACFDGQVNEVRKQEDFERQLATGAKDWASSCIAIEQALTSALNLRDSLLNDINNKAVNSSIRVDQALELIKAQLYNLFEPHFLSYTNVHELKQYPRYLRAIESRIEKLDFASKIADEEAALASFQSEFDKMVKQLGHPEVSANNAYVYLNHPQMRAFALSLEEWRVSLFAQHLKTAKPVSEKRLNKEWQQMLEALNQF